MRKQSITKEVAQRKIALADRLMELKEYWPVNERAMWCIQNGYNSDSIRKLYLMGSINSIPVAEKIIDAIELYKKNNHIAA